MVLTNVHVREDWVSQRAKSCGTLRAVACLQNFLPLQRRAWLQRIGRIGFGPNPLKLQHIASRMSPIAEPADHSAFLEFLPEERIPAVPYGRSHSAIHQRGGCVHRTAQDRRRHAYQDFRSDSDGISRRCHPHRCRGLAVTDGDDILLADSPEDFATRTVGLMTDSAERKHIGCAARNLAKTEYGWPEVTDILEKIVSEAKTK